MHTRTELQLFLINNKRTILFFLLVGALSAVINLSSFALLWRGFAINYQIAVSIAYVLSVVFHYLANRVFTFQSHSVSVIAQIPKYLTMTVINYVITLCIVRFIVEGLHLSPYLGILAAIGTTVNIGYLMSRFWVFRHAT